MNEAWCPLRVSYRDSLVDVPKVIWNPYAKRCPEGIMGENVLNELVGLGAVEGQPGLKRGNTSMQGEVTGGPFSILGRRSADGEFRERMEAEDSLETMTWEGSVSGVHRVLEAEGHVCLSQQQ